MGAKDNVRQRRQERLKALQERGADYPAVSGHALSPYSSSREDLRLSPLQEPLTTDSPEPDPEYLWKTQQRYWDTHYREEHTSDFWDGFWSPAHFRNKLIVSVMVFGLLWGLFQLEEPWAMDARGFVEQALTEEFDFESIGVWYEEHFDGFPTFIPTMESFKAPESTKVSGGALKTLHKPAAGTVAVPFAKQHPGVVLKTAPSAEVVSVDEGRVIYVGTTAQTGLTVIVQHPHQLRTVYGHLGRTSLKENDWLKSGQTVGIALTEEGGRDGKVYFAMKRSEEFLDPAGVMNYQ